jgi:outer membrane protein OmpA-like peptidoglycan-associated protein
MTTLQGLARWTLFPEKPATPYFNIGPHLTVGGDNPAGGAVFGLGYDYVVGRRYTLFAEATAYATFPDDGIDSRDDGRAAFDGLGFWGVGIRASLEKAPHPPVIRTIEVPDTLYRGEPATFTVRVSEETSRPADFTWTFGDGSDGTGPVADNTYPLPGTYQVQATVSNAAGTDRQQVEVRVREPTEAAQILAFRPDTTVVTEGERVQFGARTRGSQPLTLTWAFGDDAETTQQIRHEFEDQPHLGSLENQVSQGYRFVEPGVHTVSLTASNRFGIDRRDATIRVQNAPEPPVLTQELSPCERAQVPDTVYFEFDESILRPESIEVLKSKLDLLRQCPRMEVRLAGYADWIGPASYNRDLSRRRAEAVQDYYIDNGIDADRFVVRGFGELPPPCPEETTGKGCQKLRRVEAVIVLRESLPTSDASSASAASAPPTSASSGSASSGSASSEPASSEPAPTEQWSLVVASLSTAADASRAAETFRARLSGHDHRVYVRSTQPERHRVLVGTFDSSQAALSVRDALADHLPDATWPLPLRSADQASAAAE